MVTKQVQSLLWSPICGTATKPREKWRALAVPAPAAIHLVFLLPAALLFLITAVLVLAIAVAAILVAAGHLTVAVRLVTGSL